MTATKWTPIEGADDGCLYPHTHCPKCKCPTHAPHDLGRPVYCHPCGLTAAVGIDPTHTAWARCAVEWEMGEEK